jgi:hypothetical protein
MSVDAIGLQRDSPAAAYEPFVSDYVNSRESAGRAATRQSPVVMFLQSGHFIVEF